MFFKKAAAVTAVFWASQAFSFDVNLTYSYEDAINQGQYVSGTSSAEIPYVNSGDENMTKSIFLINYAKEIKSTLEAYSSTIDVFDCDDIYFPVQPMRGGFVDVPVTTPCWFHTMRDSNLELSFENQSALPEPAVDMLSRVDHLADDFQAKIDSLVKLYETSHLYKTKSVKDLIEVSNKLVENILSADNIQNHLYYGGDYNIGLESMSMVSTMSAMPAGRSMGSAGPNVTAGGAQDAGLFKSTVENGGIPDADSVTFEGFLSEFNLQLSAGEVCEQTICVRPGVYRTDDKLYVQIGMETQIENFVRKPLNLSIVVDVSGSMSDTDGTDLSRLAWSKLAALKTLDNLVVDQDIISLVVFDTESEVLIPSTLLTSQNKADLVRIIESLHTKNSTNVEAGLRDGFEQLKLGLLKKALSPLDYESRAIVLTDAGLNTGITDEDIISNLVSEFPEAGLTVVGVGVNFHQDFVHKVTLERGGNYIFVKNGKELDEMFSPTNFDYLMSPIAHNLDVYLSFEGVDVGTSLKVTNTYGVPGIEGENNLDAKIINVNSLFLAGPAGGGAMLIELDMSDR